MSNIQIKEQKPESKEYQSPIGNTSKHLLKIKNLKLNYEAKAEWLTLFKNEKPIAEMFHTSYSLERKKSDNRPITFVFNGGPGAASAYLHLGSLGPKRVKFAKNGNTPKPPVELIDNEESWLPFTDLVFVDPVGTGFSRSLNDNEKEKNEGKENQEFYGYERDLESLSEFIQRYLSKNNRWTSKVFIAGESYGGYRVARLAKKIQHEYGIPLSGAIIISPALEINLLFPNDYDIHAWVDLFPSYVASNFQIGKTKYFDKKTPMEKVVKEAEDFAANDLSKLYFFGNSINEKEKNKIFEKMSLMLGMPLEYIKQKNGKIHMYEFASEVKKDEQKVLGRYDASILGTNPFPDRKYGETPDPLAALGLVFTAGINSHLRDNLGVKTDREYHLLNYKVNEAWKVDMKKHALDANIGSMDDLRFGIALNPFMKVFICHGYFDLVTPYYSSKRLINHIIHDDETKNNVEFKAYKGGHMFYSWDSSRKEFMEDIKKIYE